MVYELILINFAFLFALVSTTPAPTTTSQPETTGAEPLLHLIESYNVSFIPTCQAPNIVSCIKARVNFESIGSDRIEFPEGVVMTRMRNLSGANMEGFDYEGIDGSEAILTLHNVASSEINFVTFGAFINLARTDRLLRVENCDEGPECYVLIQEAEEKNHPMVDVVVHPEDDDPELRGLMPHFVPSLDRQSEDTVLSVNFYYTRAFAWYTADPVGYIYSLVNSANAGYANSQVPLELRVFCVQLLEDFEESENVGAMLTQFRYSKGSTSATLNSADVAILVLSSSRGGACGVAYVNGYQHGLNVGWIGKGCQSTVTGHEIGHMFGAVHNAEISSIPPNGNFEYGYRMPYGPLNLVFGGFVTIMAYTSQPLYQTRINYYSSPEVFYWGKPTGRDDRDVRRALLERKAAMSARGDESGRCEPHKPPCYNLFDNFCYANSWHCCRWWPCYEICHRACERC